MKQIKIKRGRLFLKRPKQIGFYLDLETYKVINRKFRQQHYGAKQQLFDRLLLPLLLKELGIEPGENIKTAQP